MNIEDFGYCTYCGEVRTVRKNLDGHFRCDECGSTDIEEVGVCKICGQPIKPDEEYCEDCHNAMCKAWEKLVDTVYSRRAEGNWGKSEDWQDCKYAVCDWLEDKGVV